MTNFFNNYSNLFSILAAIFNTIAWGLYIYSQKENKSNPIGWLLSFIIIIASAWTFFSITKSLLSSATYIVGCIACLIVLIQSLKQPFKITIIDSITVIAALALIPLSFIFPNIAVYLLSIYYFATYSPFLRGLISGQNTENHTPWIVWSIANVFLILAQINHQLNHLILPISNFLCITAIAITSFAINRKHRKPNNI